MNQNTVLECARPTELSDLLEGLEAEHAELAEWLAKWSKAANDAVERGGGSHTARTFMDLESEIVAFTQKLEGHLNRACEELHPLLRSYVGAERLASLSPEAWTYDKKYELAKENAAAFHQEAQQLTEISESERLQRLTSYWKQAHEGFENSLVIEKTLLFPIAEDLLTDLDYLFS
ncbi:hypothetical protein [Gorillibacterium sp. CAU 1737]|uniref:hypothetical protein n=1 Tax=Gorillibacterium sp. CAU 1737 TaxID=3140362 RepID=UPI0032602247